MRGLEAESNLTAMSGAIGPKFSSRNQGITKHKRCKKRDPCKRLQQLINRLIARARSIRRQQPTTFLIIFAAVRHLGKQYGASDES